MNSCSFDRYLKVDRNIDFLVQLDERGLFSDENEFYAKGSGELSTELFVESGPGMFPSRETIENHEKRIDSLDIEQKNVLRRKYAEFSKLSTTQIAQLQQFHDELANQPHRERLTQTMNKYYDWLKTLGLTEQARLLDLQPDQRLAEIANIKTRQAREAFALAAYQRGDKAGGRAASPSVAGEITSCASAVGELSRRCNLLDPSEESFE